MADVGLWVLNDTWYLLPAQDLSHVRTIRASATMVTCAAFMPTSHKLVVGSFARHLAIYDVDRNYDAAGSIPDMEFAPLSMECWAPAGRKGVELLALGDAGGYVRLYEIKLDASVSVQFNSWWAMMQSCRTVQSEPAAMHALLSVAYQQDHSALEGCSESRGHI